MYVPGPPYCTYGLRAPASCVLYVPELKEASGEPADPACFPHRLHHNPDAHDDAKHSVSCHRALQLYRRHFGEDPPVHTWDFGDIGPPPSLAEDVDAPPAKRARAAAQSSAMHVSVQAPALPLCPITVRGSDSVLSLFNAFVASSGASHLVAAEPEPEPYTSEPYTSIPYTRARARTRTLSRWRDTPRCRPRRGCGAMAAG